MVVFMNNTGIAHLKKYLFYDNVMPFNANVAQYIAFCIRAAHLVKDFLINTVTPRCRSANWFILRSLSSNMLCFYLFRLDMLSVQLEIHNVSVLKLPGDLCDHWLFKSVVI